MRHVLLVIAVVLILLAFALPVVAAPIASPGVQADRVQADAAQDTATELTPESLDQPLLEEENENPGPAMIFVLLLFAFFCALWAQNTKRNPWLWFFLGLIFSIITAFVMLHKNSMDLHANGAPKARPKP